MSKMLPRPRSVDSAVGSALVASKGRSVTKESPPFRSCSDHAARPVSPAPTAASALKADTSPAGDQSTGLPFAVPLGVTIRP